MYDERIAALEEALAAANRKLTALEWKEIKPDSLPKVGDEVYRQNERTWDKVVKEVRKMYGSHHWQERRWTHYRPINAPARAAEEKL